VIPVNQFLPDALASLLQRAPLTEEKVAFAWRHAVGPALDRVSRVRLDGETLRVTVEGDVWRRELTRSTALILARLERLLGRGVVTELAVVNSAR
jgi:hypothetical protein